MAGMITIVVGMCVVPAQMSTSTPSEPVNTSDKIHNTASRMPSLVPWPRSATFGADGDAVTLSSASRVVFSSPLLAQAAQGLVEDLHTLHGVRLILNYFNTLFCCMC